ncbi:MAG: hypothetical protein B7Z66_01045 [Chromatiales bacterium 21-64-14]|nr:MAG: hypothetical protein B7Z66_01045 [Chromatiales bacterium 21-64-14]HQU16042.1 outer membrane protein transport protein [Gammaproteobacteria bacterium]
MPIRSTRIVSCLVALGCLSAGPVQASGFAITEQSGSGMGNAFAGAAASAQDASTIFFNPAGMTFLPDHQVVFGTHVISPSAEFSGTAANSPAFGGLPITGGNGGDAALIGVVPNLYLESALADHRWRVGLGINAPFGLRTDYPESWKGRYQAVKTELTTININPAVAFQATDRLSIGAGLDVMYADATLTNAVDNSAICLGLQAQGKFPAGTCAAFGLANPGSPGTDGFARVSGNNWALGYNLGVLYALTPDTRLGLHYRSKVHQTLSGNAEFSGMPGLFTANGLFVNSPATAEVTLPETVSASVFHTINREWAVMADATWTHWARFDNLVVQYDTGAQGPTVQPEQWQNTWRYSVGANYRYSDALTLRTGIAYDQTPIQSPQLRTPRIPDATRRWVAVGASYHYSPRVTIELAYAHLFVSNTSINHTDSLGHTLTGSYSSEVNLLSGQVNWAF